MDHVTLEFGDRKNTLHNSIIVNRKILYYDIVSPHKFIK